MEQVLAIINISGSIFILGNIISLIGVVFSEFLIKYFDIENK